MFLCLFKYTLQITSSIRPVLVDSLFLKDEVLFLLLSHHRVDVGLWDRGRVMHLFQLLHKVVGLHWRLLIFRLFGRLRESCSGKLSFNCFVLFIFFTKFHFLTLNLFNLSWSLLSFNDFMLWLSWLKMNSFDFILLARGYCIQSWRSFGRNKFSFLIKLDSFFLIFLFFIIWLICDFFSFWLFNWRIQWQFLYDLRQL